VSEILNESLLNRLLEARRSGVAIDHVSVAALPGSTRAAYAIADALVGALGFSPNGHKIGANTARAQQMLGLVEPLHGRTFAERTMSRTGRFDTQGGEVAVEAEIVLRLARDLTGPLPNDTAGWRKAVGDIMLGIEINQPSYRDALAMGGLAIIADNGVHAGLVLGPARSVGELDRLVDTVLRLHVDGSAVQESSARSAGVEPLQMLAWLAQERLACGRPLRAGELLASGAIVSRHALRRGTHIRVGIDDGVDCELTLA